MFSDTEKPNGLNGDLVRSDPEIKSLMNIVCSICKQVIDE